MRKMIESSFSSKLGIDDEDEEEEADEDISGSLESSIS